MKDIKWKMKELIKKTIALTLLLLIGTGFTF